jgi:predicted HicB family RNase H-like nuclease
MEERKSRYTEAQKRSADKYLKEKVEDIRIRVPKGQKQVIKEYAEKQGKSLNQFIVDLITKEME